MSQTVKTFLVCPLCGRDWHGQAPALVQKVGTFMRRVAFGPGKGVIKLLEEVGAHDLYAGGSWVTEVRGAVARLARLLGLHLTQETVRQVTREYTVHQGRRRIHDLEQRGRRWAKKRKVKAKAVGRPRRGRGGTVAPLVAETWNPKDTVGEGGAVAELVQEDW